jgi:ribulose 1,5-bisphosphate synthetase/thiazole synthase
MAGRSPEERVAAVPAHWRVPAADLAKRRVLLQGLAERESARLRRFGPFYGAVCVSPPTAAVVLLRRRGQRRRSGGPSM